MRVCVCLYRLSLCSLAYDTVMMYFIATTKPKQSTNSTQRNVMARPQTALYRVASSTRPLPNLCPAQNGNRRHCKFSVPSFRSPSFFLPFFGCFWRLVPAIIDMYSDSFIFFQAQAKAFRNRRCCCCLCALI